MSTEFPPTPEQSAAVDAFRTGRTVVITAGAGAGKTSTLQLIAEEADRQGKTVLYLAFNKSIATEAARRFPANTTCSTAHSIAFGAGGRYWAHRLNYPRQSGRDVAEILGITRRLVLGTDIAPLSTTQIARLALGTVKEFCGTADREIGAQHVPDQAGIHTPAARRALVAAVLPLAERAWADLATKDGRLRYQHDYYFKRWQLSGPRLNYDVILLDECQDTDPVLADVFKRQADHAQLILVGDRCQAIYGWRGATDIMGDFPGAAMVSLTKSFRFGPAIAAEANRWLELLGATLRMTGHDPVPSVLGPVARPDAIICRSNAGAVDAVLSAHDSGMRVALVGGGLDIKRLAEAALELQQRGSTGYPDLVAFVSWQQVVDYVEQGDMGSEDFKVGVNLIEKHGADVVIGAVERLVREEDAELVVTTAHKSKGREWDHVRVGGDFKEPKNEDGDLPDEELMLAYVTVTRAKRTLDVGSLSWINGHVRSTAAPVAPVPTIVEPTVIPEARPAAEQPQDALDVARSVARAEERVRTARWPLERAVALLALAEARAAAGEVRDDADRAADVRAIVEAYTEAEQLAGVS